MKTMYVLSKGEYSDYRVIAVCDSKETAQAIVNRSRVYDDAWSAYEVEEIPFVDDPRIQRIETLTIQQEIWDDGRKTEPYETYRVSWPSDTLFEGDAEKVSHRWVRAPFYGNNGGRLEVRGTDHERVRKVFGDLRAQLRENDALRAQKEFRG